METPGPIALSRDVEASIVPSGDKVTLQKGETAQVTQTLGGTFTVIVNGNMFRIEGGDADALGLEPVKTPAEETKRPETEDDLKQQIETQLKTVYDPEIPVNIIDLGLVYDSTPTQLDGGWRVDVKMTLTAPGCGMGPVLQQDAQNRLLCIEGVDEADVQLVWDPPWGPDKMTDEARLEQQFGGTQKWTETRRQLQVWGQRHLPPDAYASLSSSYDGVLALHRLMQSGEPSVLRGGTIGEAADEGALRRMIRDPRYWRDRDPAILRKVSDGFKRLYPQE